MRRVTLSGYHEIGLTDEMGAIIRHRRRPDEPG